MTKDVIRSEKKGSFQENNIELFKLGSEELISEEQKPSLLNLSLSESFCSNSTMDLEPGSVYKVCTECVPTPAPLKNNYLEETNFNSTYESAVCSGPASMEVSSNMNNRFGKSLSLHDVSHILPLQLTPKSVNTVSCETINSQSLSSTTKSKDSGFHRSTSCLSLTSSRRNYDHVQSKVKAYIRNIKESEALRKKNKLAQKAEITVEEPVVSNDDSLVLDKKDLMVKIKELEHELCEKAQFIDVQQKLYNNVLLKLAEAKNTIDSLRLRQLSWNYGRPDVNESHDILSKVSENTLDLEMYIQKLSYNSKQSNKSLHLSPQDKETGVNKQIHSTAETSLTEKFRPKNHSTPDKKKNFKRLSPVSKMFSSSSRLDKNLEPLSDLSRENNHSNLDNTNTSAYQSCYQDSTTVTQNKHALKSMQINNSDNLVNKSKTRIDLPNIDPFDKVKRWQASLPNINLVGTHSSSDCDISESLLVNKAEDESDSKNESLRNHKQKEVDINYILSKELVEKCRISDLEDSQPESKNHPPNSMNPLNSKKVKPPSFKTINLSGKNGNSHSEEPVKLSPSLSQYRSDYSSKKSRRKKIIPKSEVLLESDDSSSSESLSNFPKSSSHTCTNNKLTKHKSSDNEESSSVSSSVMNSPLSSASKKRSSLTKLDASNKTSKVTSTSRTNFVLREPKLNVTVPVKHTSQIKSQRYSLSNGISYKNSNMNKFLKTESSQMRAWNARNNANFYVCKEFYIRKSSSLEECHLAMEEMVRDGSSIIGDILDRSNC